MTTLRTRKALPLVCDSNDYNPQDMEQLKSALVHVYINKGEEYMLEETSWYADWKAKNTMNEDLLTVQYGPLNWDFEMLGPEQFQATCHLDAHCRLQVEGAGSAELHQRIVAMMVRWLQIRPKQ